MANTTDRERLANAVMLMSQLGEDELLLVNNSIQTLYSFQQMQQKKKEAEKDKPMVAAI